MASPQVTRLISNIISNDAADRPRLEKWKDAERRRSRNVYLRQARCLVETLVWPLDPRVFAFLGTAVASMVFSYLTTDPNNAIYVSWMIVCSLILVMKMFIASLLRYRGWLAGKLTWHTKIWGMLMTYCIPASTTPHCFDHLLPPLPFPNPLKVTVSKFLKSVKPIISEEEYTKLSASASDFIATIGWKLHLMLLARAVLKWNWFSDWWKQYAYLASRAPLFVSSVTGADSYKVSFQRLDRLAVWTHGFWRFVIEGRHTGELEQLKLNGLIPLCMSNTKYITGTTRIPGKDMDRIEYNDPLKTGYFVVRCLGHYYKIHMYDDQSVMLGPATIKLLYEQILAHATYMGPASVDPAIFTSLPRPEWAAIRDTMLASLPAAAAVLEDIEKAAFIINLEEEFDDTGGNVAAPLSGGIDPAYFNFGVHGSGHVWYDKSIVFNCFRSGRMAVIFEHSSNDGLVFEAGKDYAAIEEFYAHKIHGFSWFDKKGINVAQPGAYNKGCFREPSMLDFGDLSSLAPELTRAHEHWNTVANDVVAKHVLSDNVDRRVAKRVRVSPDALVQTAIQLAYYRMHSKFDLTYQPATLQHFAYGRTENVRPLTQSKIEFVKAMCEEGMANKEKFRLLKLASDEHSDLTKSAMSMGGVDRHLFALYVIMKGRGMSHPFLEWALTKGSAMPLCTSCLPNKTVDTLKKVSKFSQEWQEVPSAGVFRHQDPNGYGVFYMEANPNRTMFVITASKSSDVTNADTFCKTLHQAFEDIHGVMESAIDPSAPAGPQLKPNNPATS